MTKMPKVTFFDNIVPFTTMKPKKNNTGKDMCKRVQSCCSLQSLSILLVKGGHWVGDWFAKGGPSYNEQTLCRMCFLTNKHFTKVRFYLCNTLNFSTLW